MEDVLARVDDLPVGTVAVGVTDREATLATHGPADHVFPLASVTKLLTAYATLIAVQDGVVHLDEPVTDQGASVRHLLAHASGLPFERNGPVQPPERRRVYSNWGFEILGDLVAGRMGVPFAAHLDLEVLQPLGMRDTRLEGSPGAGASSTVRDLLAFARELLAPTLLGPALHREATTVVCPGLEGVVPGYGRQRPCDWGLGFEIRSEKRPHWTGTTNSPMTFGHFGQSGTYLWVDPELGAACAFLGDRDFDTWAKEAWTPFNDAVVGALRARS